MAQDPRATLQAIKQVLVAGTPPAAANTETDDPWVDFQRRLSLATDAMGSHRRLCSRCRRRHHRRVQPRTKRCSKERKLLEHLKALDAERLLLPPRFEPWKVRGAWTGRIPSAQPSIQNLPKPAPPLPQDPRHWYVVKQPETTNTAEPFVFVVPPWDGKPPIP